MRPVIYSSKTVFRNPAILIESQEIEMVIAEEVVSTAYEIQTRRVSTSSSSKSDGIRHSGWQSPT